MSALARRSAIVLALLFGLVFAAGTGVMYYFDVPLVFALIFAVVVVLFQFLAGPWIIGLLFKIEWINPETIAPEFAQWLRQACTERKIPVPRFGLIRDGNPNAFTYGHVPGDARLVVTSGLLDMLNKEETHAVVAHELGHISHWDFVVMTVAQLATLVLYYIYVFARRRTRASHEGLVATGVAIGAYVAYIISEYVALFLSRVREYFADDFSAQTTKDPNSLSSALVKIAYGLARNPQAAAAQAAEGQKDKKDKKKGPGFDPGRATAALGICNVAASSTFAMTMADDQGHFSPSVMAEAMQWDLKSPWGTWFELNCTHPLTARRILAMNAAAKRLGQPPLFAHDPQGVHKVYTSNFVLEFLTYSLPVLGGIAGLAVGAFSSALNHSMAHYSLALIGVGLGWLIKTVCAYPGTKNNVRGVADLVGTEMNVSPVNPVPCAIEGTIIGRGVPGLFFSQNLVLHDGTGFLTLQYRQPFSILEFLFGWLKAGEYNGRKARVTGWFRRAPGPYFEIQSVEMLDGPSGNIRCYALYGFYASAILLAVLGAVLLWLGTAMNF